MNKGRGKTTGSLLHEDSLVTESAYERQCLSKIKQKYSDPSGLFRRAFLYSPIEVILLYCLWKKQGIDEIEVFPAKEELENIRKGLHENVLGTTYVMEIQPMLIKIRHRFFIFIKDISLKYRLYLSGG